MMSFTDPNRWRIQFSLTSIVVLSLVNLLPVIRYDGSRVITKLLEGIPNMQVDDLPYEVEWPFMSPDDVKMYFIHVGKAGGSSLNKRFGMNRLVKRLGCHMKAASTEESQTCFNHGYNNSLVSMDYSGSNRSAFQDHLFGLFHVENAAYRPRQRRWLMEHTNLLVFAVRDPVSRFISAFNFHHQVYFVAYGKMGKEAPNIAVQFYQDCFPDAEHLGLSQTVFNSSSFSEDCRSLGRTALIGERLPKKKNETGSRPFAPHFYFNYEYYTRRTWHNRSKAVAVIRTESMWKDVARIEDLLEGDPDIFLNQNEPHKATHGSESFKRQSGVSELGAIGICCALRKEIQYYQDLIISAVNLNGKEKIETIQESFKRCNVYNWQNMSPETLVEFDWENWRHEQCLSL